MMPKCSAGAFQREGGAITIDAAFLEPKLVPSADELKESSFIGAATDGAEVGTGEEAAGAHIAFHCRLRAWPVAIHADNCLVKDSNLLAPSKPSSSQFDLLVFTGRA